MSDDFRPVNRVYHLAGDFADPVRVWNDFLAVVNATAGVKIVGAHHHVFPFYQTGSGLSGVVMLSESHAAIHTWPEHRYASVTLSSCGGLQSVQSFADRLKAQWPDCAVEYQETCVPGQSLLIETEGPVMARQTPYQRLELFRSAVFGKVMALDGIIQTTELDAFVYHEALCLVPLALHAGRDLDVLLVGGGDGYSLATVLKDPSVRSVAMIDIDREVVESATAWFGNAAALADPRVRVVYDDALAWLEVEKTRFDVIVVDLTDPAEGTVAEPLRSDRFYAALASRLKPGGFLSQQIGSPWFLTHETTSALALARQFWGHVAPYFVTVPCFPGGQHGFMVATDEAGATFRDLPFPTRWYTPQVAMTAFVLPPFVRDLVV